MNVHLISSITSICTLNFFNFHQRTTNSQNIHTSEPTHSNKTPFKKNDHKTNPSQIPHPPHPPNPRPQPHPQHLPPTQTPPNLPHRLPALPKPHRLHNRIPPPPHQRRATPLALHNVLHLTLPLHDPRSPLHQPGLRESPLRRGRQSGGCGGCGGEGGCGCCAGRGCA